jgi:hypothetical protein
MELSREDLEELYTQIESKILACSTSSHLKKVGHEYFLSYSEKIMLEKHFQIASAVIRREIEKVFLKYVDQDLLEQVKEEKEKRKRGPRKKLVEETNTSKETKITQVGRFIVESS